MRDEVEIEFERQAVELHNMATRGSKWPGMTYEQGVAAALEWVLGDREEKPYTEA